MTPHDNILIISSITNDTDINSAVLVEKGTVSLYTGLEIILLIMLLVNCITVFNDIKL